MPYTQINPGIIKVKFCVWHSEVLRIHKDLRVHMVVQYINELRYGCNVKLADMTLIFILCFVEYDRCIRTCMDTPM